MMPGPELRESMKDLDTLEGMKIQRKIVIRKLMGRGASGHDDVNDVIRWIKQFDTEAITAMETVARWQDVCLHFTEDGPMKLYQSLEERAQL